MTSLKMKVSSIQMFVERFDVWIDAQICEPQKNLQIR